MTIPLDSAGRADLTHASIEQFPRQWDGESRKITASWPLDGQTPGSLGRHVVLAVTHNKWRKVIEAEVHIVTITELGYERVLGIGHNSGAGSHETVASVPVARYSKKALTDVYLQVAASTKLVDALHNVSERASTEAA